MNGRRRRFPLRTSAYLAAIVASLVAPLALIVATAGAAGSDPLPPDKQALENRFQSDREASMRLTPVPPHPEAVPRDHVCCVEQSVAVRVVGLLDSPQVPFPNTNYAFTNHWNDPSGFALAAGSLRSDPTIGVVSVIMPTPTGQLQSHVEYMAPAGSGIFRIVAVNGHIIELDSNVGRRWQFDLSTHQFSPIS